MRRSNAAAARPRLAATLVAMLVLLTFVAAPVRASEDPLVAVIGEGVREVSEHHYALTVADGTTYTFHGGDPDTIVGGHGTDIGPGDPERDPVCATDYYIHVLYGRPSSASNRYTSVVGQIRSSVKRMNAVLNEEGLESGNKTGDYKVRCDAGNVISVGQFTASVGSNATWDQIRTGARNAGFTASNADYLIFWDGTYSGVCGVANISFDDRPDASNPNNNGGGYAVTYNPCWDTRTPMHENGHNQGAVQQNAPDSTGTGGHCNDTYDVMCYAPDGGNRNQAEVRRCSDKMHFDCDHDTYFDAAPEPGEWLATRWNIGSTVNRFISFNSLPTANFSHSCAQNTCSFTDTSTDPDGSIAARAWAFGDGGTSSAVNPSHTYAGSGTYTVQLTVTDDKGGTATTSKQVVIQVPTASITTPAEGSTAWNPPITIAGSATPGTLVRVREGTEEIGATTASVTGAWFISADLAVGPHTITATATDAVEEGPPSAPRSFTVDVDYDPPAPPEITSPTPGLYGTQSHTVSGNAEPGSTVKVFASGGVEAQTTAAADGSFSTTVTIADGSWQLTATATDPAGNESAHSDPVAIDVDTTAPDLNVDQGDPQVFLLNQTAFLSGNASDASGIASVRVEVFASFALGPPYREFTAEVDDPDPDGVFAWHATLAGLSPGLYQAVVTATDGAGRETTRMRRLIKLGTA